ncbi:MAG: hypothetical protein M0R40_10400 [Firmicutes bacterium]|nr:hypothetical protein [Bacillota bacterium]
MNRILSIIFIATLLLSFSGCNMIEKDIYEKPIYPKADMCEGKNIYKNKSLGFQLTFPDEWSGWFKIAESPDGIVGVNFYGKSNASTTIYGQVTAPGLPLFMIMNKKHMMEEKQEGIIDNIIKMGVANNEEYYFATRTDASIGVLFDIINTVSNIDNTQLEFVKEDYHKMRQMKNEINTVLESFKTIE